MGTLCANLECRRRHEEEGGSDCPPEGEPQRAKSTTFKTAAKIKVAPYCVFDMADNNGWVGVGIACEPMTWLGSR
jgi:hypothetical protein